MIVQKNFFLGEVRNINDPFKSGRVQVRIYGNHDDEQNIKDEDLPWAMPLHPITSAATAKTGIIPTGMIVGSRVFGMFIDEAHQYPIIFGPYSRGSKLLDDKVVDGGQEILDPKQKGVDTPAPGHPEDNNNAGTTPTTTMVGGKAIDAFGAKYNEAPTVDNGEGPQGLKVARQQFAPNADENTIAAVDPSIDLPQAIAKVGTNGEILPNMMKLLNMVRSFMAMNNSSSSSSSSGNTSGINQYAVTALTGALSILANTYGYNFVVNILAKTFVNNNFSLVEAQYQPIITQAMTNFVQNGIKSNFVNLPYQIIPPANLLPQSTPVPTPLETVAPDYYVQQWYDASSDPYAGYVQWEGPAGDYVYTVRLATQPNYDSADDSMTGTAQTEFVTNFSPLFAIGIVTVAQVNQIMDLCVPHIATNAQTASLGNNSASNILSMIMQLIPQLGSLMNNAQSIHLPRSVLNVASMTQTIQAFTKNQAILKKMQNISAPAFQVPSSLSSLSSLLSGGGLSSILSGGGLSSSLGGLSSIGGDLSSLTSGLSGIGDLSSVTSSLGDLTGGSGILSLAMGASGGLSSQSLTSLISSGLPTEAISALNSDILSNPALSIGSINVIASLSTELSQAGIAAQNIVPIQQLLTRVTNQ